MNATLLIKISEKDLEDIKYDALKIAEIELSSGVLPISVKRPFPKKKDETLKRSKESKLSDKSIEKKEEEIYSSVKNKINDKIESLESKIEKSKNRINNMGFGGKIFVKGFEKSKLKSFEGDLNSINDLLLKVS